MLRFNQGVEDDLGGQEPTLLFESRTLRHAAHKLAERRPEALRAWAGLTITAPVADTPESTAEPAPEPGPRTDPRGQRDVAVVGMAGRYPGAGDLDAFWDLLRRGGEHVVPVPVDRWDTAGGLPTGEDRDTASTHCPTGGFLTDVDLFDPRFFRISPADAATMDPQERLFLQTAWHALEDAGIPPSALGDPDDPDARRTGVFVGVTTATHSLWGPRYWDRGEPFFPTSMPWAVANRVSHAFDLRGPSVAVDTACASSLNAVHLAIRSLRAGECAVAIAGGVNLYLHPWKYDYLGHKQMVSATGTCSAFGAEADGFVPGEGVGALVLKPLADAERDGDRILGVLRGSAVNHGGRAQGFTVPQPQAQAAVVRSALADAAVEPGSVSYVEAHGTGTRLGDPVEVAGLALALREHGPGARRLLIGSVKPQIGHLEAAAGVAGVTKALLQLRHRTLVPSLRAEPPNPALDLPGLGFEVVTSAQPWPDDAPRRAGVSSFGAGGSNCHVVLEEYPAPASARVDVPGRQVFCVSARSDEQLRDLCLLLADRLAEPVGTTAEIAHHLQVRREPLSHRLAVVTDSVPELRAALRAYGQGAEHPLLVLGRRALGARPDRPAADADPDRLARSWTDGADVDWATRWPAPLPHVPLPLYPFARERIALPPLPGDPTGASGLPIRSASAGARGLVVRGTGSVRHVGLDARDILLDHHRVSGTPVLPAVAVIGVVGAAAADCGLPFAGVRNLVLTEPITVTGTCTVSVEFTGTGTGDRRFAVTSDGPAGRRTHAEGAVLATVGAEPDRVRLADVRERCPGTADPSELYRLLHGRGLELDAAYRGIREIWTGESELLAHVVRDPAARDLTGPDPDPAVFDSCLQSSVLLTGGDELRLPFSVGRCELFAPLPAEVCSRIALGRVVRGARSFDVEVCDPDGAVVLRVHDLWVRDFPGTPETTGGDELVLCAPVWTAAVPDQPAVPVGDRLIVLADRPELGQRLLGAGLAAGGGRAGHRALTAAWTTDPGAAGGTLADALADGPDGAVDLVLACSAVSGTSGDAEPGPAAEVVLHALRLLARSPGIASARLLCVAVGGDAWPPAFAALAGLVTTATAELSRCTAAVLHVPDGADPRAAAGRLLASSWDRVAYRATDGDVLGRGWRRIPAGDRAPLRDEPVCLVTGGNGGVGRHVVAHLVTRYGARVVNVCRSAVPEDLFPPEIRASVTHVRADVATVEGAAAAVTAALRVAGRIDGIFHCAAVLHDEFALAATSDGVRAVLAPKVDGARHLDRLTAGLAPDVFCVFSSLAAAVPNPGQSAYACANAWLDAFAQDRALRSDRAGGTWSVMWPFWQDGGMHGDPENLERLRTGHGLRPIAVAEALEALDAALGQPEPVVAVVPRSARMLAAVPPSAPTIPVEPGVDVMAESGVDGEPVRGDDRAAVASAFLVARIAALSRTEPGRVDVDAEIADYGLDSLAFTRLSGELNTELGTDTTPAIFFEYATVRALAAHLAETGDIRIEVPPAPTPAPRLAVAPPSTSSTPAAAGPEPTAIIGMAGKFPLSDDVETFWAHLHDGDDLVTEIPADRWDWREHYDPDMAAPNTTNSKWGGFLPDIASFDHAFFGISPREAALMDPQHRLFLQTAYAAIEEAGYRPSQLSADRTGVFVGAASHDYFELVRASGRPMEGYSTTGMFHSLLANRVSYYLNLTGPSFPIDAACSSSLVALHSAIEALRSGSCDTAIAGGVNLIISPTISLSFSRAGMLSPTGRCRTFDQGADGYVRGEGVAAVLLKPLSRALADGDHVHGVIRGSAVNHGGKVNTLTTPNPNAQADLIERAVRTSGISAADLDYVEMHGTGTPLGDPIEVNGLKKALNRLTTVQRLPAPPAPVIGSVKSVVGHLEAAAGMAGLFKVLLALKHQVIPRNLHLDRLNEHIRLDGTGIRIARDRVPWTPCPDHRRTAGISSFGFGGINAHVVIEEAPK